MVEGVRGIEEAHKRGIVPTKVFALMSGLPLRVERTLDAFASAGVAITRISVPEMRRLSDADSSPGALALFRRPDQRFDADVAANHSRALVLDTVADPGNLGAIIRSAVAFGFRLVLLVGDCADPFAPKVIRATAGAIFGVSIMRLNVSGLKDLARRTNAIIISAQPRGEKLADSTNLVRAQQRPIYLVLGSEAHGVSPELMSIATARLTIPHEGDVESLNVVVAAGILMSHIFNAGRS